MFSLFQVAELTEVDVNDLMTAFVKPRIKVRTFVYSLFSFVSTIEPGWY